ncbi:MAG: hypothetical protein SVR81_07145 [Chloroflexota bacterium]|nr:hypothetical protein [Chloroflexota bacterium]
MLPVALPKADAQRYYDRLSKIYDWLTASERSLIEKNVSVLSPTKGETILEIGCGTGTGLTSIARPSPLWTSSSKPDSASITPKK